MNAVLDILVILADDSKASYTLEPQTTFAQLRELLKEDGFLENDDADYVFKILETDVLIPKSQEKVKTLEHFKIGKDLKICVVQKKTNINAGQEAKKEIVAPGGMVNSNLDIDALRAAKENDEDFLASITTGKERKVRPSGDLYEGQMKKGKMHGKGRITWTDGGFYEGDWVQDNRTGKGRKVWGEGEYKGDM
jgi:hypothetical protein